MPKATYVFNQFAVLRFLLAIAIIINIAEYLARVTYGPVLIQISIVFGDAFMILFRSRIFAVFHITVQLYFSRTELLLLPLEIVKLNLVQVLCIAQLLRIEFWHFYKRMQCLQGNSVMRNVIILLIKQMQGQRSGLPESEVINIVFGTVYAGFLIKILV